MTAPVPTLPKFPGGVAASPEATAGGCRNPACSCLVDAGHAYCCRACARAGDGAEACGCHHFGCTARAF